MSRLGFVGFLLAVMPAVAQAQPTATDIVEKSQQAFYYPGSDMKAKVTMELIAGEGKKRTRVLAMLRKNDSTSRNQKYFLYFHQPGDVRRTAFLVWKYPEKDDDRWIFIPALNAVRRVAASDSRSSFVGSDFTYEDISGRDLSADAHTLLHEEKLGEADCYVIESIPKSGAEYTKKRAWIDQATFLPRQEEYYDAQNELARRFTADAIENVAAGEGKTIPTVVKRTMRNVKSGHRTEVRFESVAYDVGLDDEVFAERALQSPPRKWIE
ncbi:MAG: outer membrane lipoprotein-sorting protein [Deltaproteobacteria bacterium]|nr:outer membrane lipoprotein-sorting protein [Deltaproteobacteria bacterium]